MTKGNKLIGTSHDGKYTYHLGTDRYIYQRRESDGKWMGWMCAERSLDAFFWIERTDQAREVAA